MEANLAIRKQEMINLVESIPELLKECIRNFDSEKLDENYIIMGHGLGGTTAI